MLRDVTKISSIYTEFSTLVRLTVNRLLNIKGNVNDCYIWYIIV